MSLPLDQTLWDHHSPSNFQVCSQLGVAGGSGFFPPDSKTAPGQSFPPVEDSVLCAHRKPVQSSVSTAPSITESFHRGLPLTSCHWHCARVSPDSSSSLHTASPALGKGATASAFFSEVFFFFFLWAACRFQTLPGSKGCTYLLLVFLTIVYSHIQVMSLSVPFSLLLTALASPWKSHHVFSDDCS